MKDYAPLDHFGDEIVGADQSVRHSLEQLAGHLFGVNHLHHHWREAESRKQRTQTPLLCSNIHTLSTLKRSTLSTLNECAEFQTVSVVPNRIPCGALTGNDERDCRRGSSPPQ